MMKPASRRRGALALLALAGCGVAQNMGQWVGGEHCAGSHCGPSKEEKRLAREAARRLEKTRAKAESGLDGNRFDGAGVGNIVGACDGAGVDGAGVIVGAAVTKQSRNAKASILPAPNFPT